MPTLKEEILALKELLSRGWCQKALARDSRGNAVSPLSENAVRFSISGGAARVGLSVRAWTHIDILTSYRPLEINDAAESFTEVSDFLDRCIAEAPMNRNDIPDLLRVREILAKAWTNEEAALDSNGNRVDARDPNAVKWCIIGACCKMGQWYMAEALKDYSEGLCLVDVNNTQASGLAFIDRVIAELDHE